MKVDIAKLLELQELDALRSEKEARITQTPKRIKEVEGEFLDASNAILDAEARLKSLEKKRQDMRAERRALEEKAFSYKVQLATIKKQSDYEAVSEEIEKAKKRASEIEEAEIQLLFDIDDANENVSKMKTALPSIRAETDSKISKLKELLSAEEKSSNELAAKISEIKSEVSESFLSTYERLRNSGKKFPLVVALGANGCSGCFIKVASLPIEIENSPTPVCCEHCGRILY